MPNKNQPRSEENNYGGVRRHHPEHDPRIERNFTPDNQDHFPNSAQYNDSQETRFNVEDRLRAEYHDLPEPHPFPGDYHPSNYSEGGHGRPLQAAKKHDNADNKDYPLNKDFEQGARQKYEDSSEKIGLNDDLPEPE